MTIAQIDDTDLELLLDFEILDSKIDAVSEQQRDKKGKKKSSKKVFIDQLSWL